MSKEIQKYKETTKALRRTADDIGASGLPFLLKVFLFGALILTVMFLMSLVIEWLYDVKNEMVDVSKSLFTALLFLGAGWFMITMSYVPFLFFISYNESLKSNHKNGCAYFFGFGVFALYSIFGLLVFTNFPSQFTGQNLNANLATTAKYDNVFADKAKETTVWSWLFPFKLEDIKLHTVVYGETLETIAKKYETSIEEILNFNEGLDADKLKEGQKIKIPN